MFKNLSILIVAFVLAACSSSQADSKKSDAVNITNNGNSAAQTSDSAMREPLTIEAFYLERELKDDLEKYKNRVLILEYAELVGVESDSLTLEAQSPHIICQGDFSGESWEKVKAKVKRIKEARDKGSTDVRFPHVVVKGIYEKGGRIGDDIIIKDCSFVRADDE